MPAAPVVIASDSIRLPAGTVAMGLASDAIAGSLLVTVTTVGVAAALGRSRMPIAVDVADGANALPMKGSPTTLTPMGCANITGVCEGGGVPT